MQQFAGAVAVIALALTSCAGDQLLEGVDPPAPPPSPSSTATSLEATTTLTPELVDYATWAAGIAQLASDLRERGTETNAAWDERTATYVATAEALRNLHDEAATLAEGIEMRAAPRGCEELAAALAAATAAMSDEASAMIAGLKSSDDGSARRQALAAFERAQHTITDAVTLFHDNHGLTPSTDSESTASSSVATTTTTTTTTTSTTTTTLATTATRSECHPSYVGDCVPVNVSDVDCAGGSGNGPHYVGRVGVVGPDVYGLDRDNDGVGCE